MSNGTIIEERVHGAQELLASIFNTVREPLLLLDAELRVIKANHSFYEVFKVDASTTEGKLVYDLGNGQWDIPSLRELLTKILPENTFFDDFKVTHLFENIGERVMLLNARKMFQNGPEILVAFEDVTEHMRADKSLRDSELRYRRLFESAEDGILILNGDTGKILDANPYLQRIVGWSHPELVGKELWEIGLLKDKEASVAFIRTVQHEGYGRYSNLPLRAKDGRNISVEVVANSYHVDSTAAIQCNIRDITLRQLAEEARNQSEARFRGLAEGIPQLVWTCTPEGYYDYLSRQWGDYTGTPSSAQLGQEWKHVVHPDDRQPIKDVWAGARSSASPFEMEYRLRRFDGQYRWFKVQGVPILNEKREVEKWFGTCTDIQTQKDTESVLEQARQQAASYATDLEKEVAERTAALQATISELEAFSYSVSHDLQSPLRAMQGYSQALLEDYANKLDEQGQRYLSRIERAAGRLDTLVQDILAYSRISRGELPLGPVDLEPLIEEVIQQNAVFQPPGADIAIERPFPKVIGNSGLLTQCLSNLLANAVKFVALGVHPQVRVWTKVVDGQIRILIADNGIGIDPNHSSRIFQMFGRVHPEEKYEGTGIGLAIVKKAVERMGGTLGFDSQAGEGSCFWFQLPGARHERSEKRNNSADRGQRG